MKKPILSILLLLILNLSSSVQALAFSDVQQDDPYYPATEYLQEQNIISGYPDGTFQTQSLINRAEFTKIVIGATHTPGQYANHSGNCFPDVHEEWFATYVCLAHEENVIDGYPSGFFEASQEVNFAEAAKIIVNSFGYKVELGDPWYEPYETVLSEENAIPASILSPDQKITRGEMAEIIYRIHSLSFQGDPDCELYTYQDAHTANLGKHCLNHVTVKPIYFVARDQTNEVIPNWKENMTDIFAKLETFYEEQFDHKIDIVIEEPELRYGDKNLSDYTSLYDQAFKTEMAEKVRVGDFIIYSVYYNSPTGSFGGAGILDSNFFSNDFHNNGSISINPSFWLEDEALCTTNKYGTNCYGYVHSAHELGHSLGLSHPWDMDINKDTLGNIIDPEFKFSESGNVMAYGGTSLLSGDINNPLGAYFVMEEAKEKMLGR